MDNLINAMMCTRPDIAQAVGVVSRFIASLVESSEVLTRGPKKEPQVLHCVSENRNYVSMKSMWI